MEQTPPKTNLLIELAKRKAGAHKAGVKPENFGKFATDKPRARTGGNVGPSWGGRNGQGKP